MLCGAGWLLGFCVRGCVASFLFCWIICFCFSRFVRVGVRLNITMDGLFSLLLGLLFSLSIEFFWYQCGEACRSMRIRVVFCAIVCRLVLLFLCMFFMIVLCFGAVFVLLLVVLRLHSAQLFFWIARSVGFLLIFFVLC